MLVDVPQTISTGHLEAKITFFLMWLDINNENFEDVCVELGCLGGQK
jgi:hypothetical protein